jgi:putative transposase
MLTEGAESSVGATRASPEIRPQRKQVRLPRHIYGQPGYYFVTACVDKRRQVFGRINAGCSELSQLGSLVSKTIFSVPDHHPAWGIDCFVVMPNHWHAVLFNLKNESNAVVAGPAQASLSSVVGSLKSAITRIARQNGLWDEKALMQRGFYEHVIRSEESLTHICEYVLHNPMRWDCDYLNPLRKLEDPFERWIRIEDSLQVSLWFSGDARVAPTPGGTDAH